MNKLLIPNGGMPFEGDDLLWMQDAFRTGFGLLADFFTTASAFNDGSCILKGVNLSAGSGNITYSPGTMFIAGELCSLAGGVAVGAQGNETQWWIELESFADPAGTQIFADAVAKDTYQVRRAKVTNSATIPSEGAMQFALLDSYKVINTFVPTTLLNGLTAEALNPVSVRKNHRYITFTGSMTSDGTTASGSEIFTLPLYYRPAANKTFLSHTVDSGSNARLILITVNAIDGKVRIYNHNPSDPDPLAVGTVGLADVHYPLN
jgi:hypothetical protein